MVEHPESLPRLNSLSFSDFPSFGLLLGVLFRRNILRPMGKSVEKGKEVLLPDFPCPNLLLRLEFVLNGRIAPTDVLQEPLPEHDITIDNYLM